jgi:hypothetical protein
MNMDEILFGKKADARDDIEELRALIMKSNQMIIDYIDADREEKSEFRSALSMVREMCELNMQAIERLEDTIREL